MRLRSLTESLAEELRGSGVTVTVLCPCITATPMLSSAVEASAALARLLLHDPEIDAPFMDALQDGLPDEAARLAYLNHLAWQARS